jgi:hypothetical protein
MSFDLISLEDFVLPINNDEVLSLDKKDVLPLNTLVNVVVAELGGKPCNSVYYCFDLEPFFMPPRDRYLFIISLNSDAKMVYAGWREESTLKRIDLDKIDSDEKMDYCLDIYQKFCKNNNFYSW